MSASGEEREGPLTRVTNFVYRLLVIEVAFVLATLPALLGILLLDQEPSNIPLYGLFALFFGPAITAGVYAWRGDHDLIPWLRYWKGWVESFRQTLAVWTPVVGFATLASFNAAFAQVPASFLLGGAVLAGAVVVAGVATLVVIATFDFRTRDLFRVVMYGLASAPLSALGVLSLFLVVGAIVVLWSDWVAVLLASVMLWLLTRTVGPMLAQVRQDLVVNRG
ncbi:hypothetical protein [Nesterenkonia sp. HG001]|uniref:hypothetical protein n=1 Tax=Nesterenkonia sp. HG001 TaxID=2983207 RepID=UPI002AC3F892|nr:hypothetical protein [Nesterenkonia sp. HG001]MDZ5079032.1 hypothetical protein [Nesterenkonia sp. HG001]